MTSIDEKYDALEEFDEDTVLVVYGDHLPGLNLSPEDLSNESLFQTDYVVWTNFELEGEDKDLYTYQLGSYVLDLLGIHEGTMNRYQQTAIGTEGYEHGMELLQYDMLYGKNYSHDGVNPYVANELQMGIYDITISHAMMCNGSLYIFGENLTEASGVYIGEELWKTSYYNPNMVVVRNAEINVGDVISVKQAGKNKKPLSTSNEIIYNGDVFEEEPIPTE